MLIFAAGCASDASRSANAVLDIAEKVMDEYPDSALTLLSDTSIHYSSERQRALHALLLTQARHKNYIDETNDSLITTAVNYFDKHGDKPRLMKSLFYTATINLNVTDYREAMTNAMQAQNIAEVLKNVYWQGRIYEIIGHILAKTYFFEESVKYYQKSAMSYKTAGIEKAHYCSLLDMAVELSNLDQYDNALKVTDSLQNTLSDQSLLSYCYSIASNAWFELGNYPQADRYADSLIKYKGIENLTAYEYLKISQIKFETGNIKDAEKYLNIGKSSISTPRDSLGYKITLLRRYQGQNDHLKAYQTLREVIKSQNEMARNIREQSAVSSQRDYYALETLKAQILYEKRKNAVIICSLIAILIFALSFVYYKYSIQRKKALINEQILYIKEFAEKSRNNNEYLQTISEKLAEQRVENNKLSQLVSQLFSEKYTQLNTLINNYYNSIDSTKSQLIFYKNIQKEIKNLIDPKNLKAIECLVDKCKKGIISKMRIQLPFLTQNDISFLSLVLAGYETRALSLFTGLKPASTYSKRKRLLERIAKSDAPDREWFISQINGSEPRA